MASFGFGHCQGVQWGHSWSKNIWVYSASVKIRVLQSTLNGIGTTMRTTCSQNFSSI